MKATLPDSLQMKTADEDLSTVVSSNKQKTTVFKKKINSYKMTTE